MRMWMIDPTLMCRKHLLGEHVEVHMLAGTIIKGNSLAGFFAKRLLAPQHMHSRHKALSDEMVKRGYNHNSPMPAVVTRLRGIVHPEESKAELLKRCPDCSARIAGDAHA